MFHPKGPTFFELIHQCFSSTERGYDLLAPKFDFTPYRTPDTVLRVVGEHLKQLPHIDNALDICCGTGAVMQMLRPLCHDRVVGIDFSRGMLEVARQKNEAAEGSARLDYIRGNVFKMPFDVKFDLAVCLSALGHIRERDMTRFLDQLAGILKPGGRFVFVTSFKPPVWSKNFWFSYAFNAAISVRNMLFRPPFIMYYLTFILPGVKMLLKNHDFEVEIKEAFKGELSHLRLVTATLRSVGSRVQGL
jgi:ubiquinone/menaquinone biosynthesis C-methylase UbiE